MTVAEVQAMTGRELVDLVTGDKPPSEAISWVASLVSNDSVFEAVRELRSRFKNPEFSEIPRTDTGRIARATSVQIDPDRFRAFFWRRRVALRNVGPMMEPPRSDGWAYVMISRARMGYHALDDLATALGLRADDLIEEFGTEAEIRRQMA